MPFVRSRATGVYVPKSEKLIDKVKEVLRYHHYSTRTERCYYEWVKRYAQCPFLVAFLPVHAVIYLLPVLVTELMLRGISSNNYFLILYSGCAISPTKYDPKLR